MKRLLTALAALSLLGTLWAQPQPPPPEAAGLRRGGPPGSADTNGDGKVDEVEAQQAAKQRVDMLRKQMDDIRQQFDADGDGALNAPEQTALKNKLAERGGRGMSPMVGMVDKDGDWKLSPAEEAAALQAVTQRLMQGEGGRADMPRGLGAQDPDANGDCMIDDTEARLAAEKRVDFGRKMIDRLRERAATDPQAPYPPMATELDTDRNLDVSDAEAKAAVERLMAELQKRNAVVLKYFDADKDGQLNDAERTVAKNAFAFMNEVRAERPELAERVGEMMRERLRERPGEGRRDGEGREPRRQPGRGEPPRPPQPAPTPAPAPAAEKAP